LERNIYYWTFSKKTKNLHSRYTQFDDEYLYFLRLVLKYIEPRKEKKATILYEEKDAVLEIMFIVFGNIKYGYTDNMNQK